MEVGSWTLFDAGLIPSRCCPRLQMTLAWRDGTSWQAAANACMQVQRWPHVIRTGGGASRTRAHTLESCVAQIKDKGNLNSYSGALQSECETTNRAALSLIDSKGATVDSVRVTGIICLTTARIPLKVQVPT